LPLKAGGRGTSHIGAPFSTGETISSVVSIADAADCLYHRGPVPFDPCPVAVEVGAGADGVIDDHHPAVTENGRVDIGEGRPVDDRDVDRLEELFAGVALDHLEDPGALRLDRNQVVGFALLDLLEDPLRESR
jgi:hypothetical protein